MTLTWLEISQRWPECCVPWDRDVAPGLDWEVRFEANDGTVDAIKVSCHIHWGAPKMREDLHCGCLRWNGERWTPMYLVIQARLWSPDLDPLTVPMHYDATSYARLGSRLAASATEFITGAQAEEIWLSVARLPCQPRQHLRGTRAQRKRKRAALSAARAPGTGK